MCIQIWFENVSLIKEIAKDNLIYLISQVEKTESIVGFNDPNRFLLNILSLINC